MKLIVSAGRVELPLRKWPREVCLQGAALSGRHGDAMYMEYKRSAEYKTMSFAEYLAKIKFVDPSVDLVGMDDEAQFVAVTGWSAEA